MLKRLAYVGVATLLSVSVTGSVSAQTSGTNPAACNAFASVGAVISNYILPMSVKDFAAMNSGKNTALIDGAIAKLDSDLSPSDKGALEALGVENRGLFEEAAVNLAIDVVLSGEASSAAAVANIMRQECQSFGAGKIIEFQKSIYAEPAAGQPAPIP